MKSIKLRAGIAALILVFGIMSAGCELIQWFPEAYTVWTGTTTYVEFQDKYGDLQEGYYDWKRELTNSEFNQISPSLKDDNKHIWIEDQIIDWFTDRSFNYLKAKELTAWLIKTPHALICNRTGSTVYIIIK